MQMEPTNSTAGLKPNAATNIGRSAGKTDVPVEKAQLKDVFEQSASTVAESPTISKDELEKAVESLSEYAGWGNFNIGFDTDDETDSMVITISDRDSGEIVRQIPPDQILKLRSHLQEVLGLVFDHMA
ncbi:MAG: flagellar protein FlaG [Candidatus Zixiibacteriota bacterium]